MISQLVFVVLSLTAALIPGAYDQPVAADLRYAACKHVYGTCLAAVGVTAGVTAPVTWAGWFYGVPAACFACSVAQGACMALRRPLLVAPIL